MRTIINISNLSGISGETPFAISSNPVQTLINDGTVIRSFVPMYSCCNNCCLCPCRNSCCNCSNNRAQCCYQSDFWTVIYTV